MAISGKTYRYVKWTVVIFIFSSFSYVVFTNRIILFPSMHFDYRFNYPPYEIHSDQPIDEVELINVLDSVSWRLDLAENNRASTCKIFLCRETSKFSQFAEKVNRPGYVQGFNLQPLNFIFINEEMIHQTKKQSKRAYQHTLLGGSMSHIIAHEMVHQWISDSIGFLKMRKLESWKKEGFCEYLAGKRLRQQQAVNNIKVLHENYLSGEFNDVSQGRKFYLQSLICVEYLMSHRELSFREFIEYDHPKSKVWKEISISLQ